MYFLGLDLSDNVSSRLNSSLNKSQNLNTGTGTGSVQSVSNSGEKTPLTAKSEKITNPVANTHKLDDGEKTPVNKAHVDSPLPP